MRLEQLKSKSRQEQSAIASPGKRPENSQHLTYFAFQMRNIRKFYNKQLLIKNKSFFLIGWQKITCLHFLCQQNRGKTSPGRVCTQKET